MNKTDNLPTPPRKTTIEPQTIDLTVPISLTVCLQNLEKLSKRPHTTVSIKPIPGVKDHYTFSMIYDPRILRNPTEFDVQGELSKKEPNVTRITGVGKLSKASYSSMGCIVLFMGIPGIGLPLLGRTPLISLFVVVLLALMIGMYIWSGQVALKNFIAALPRILNGERYL